MSFDKTQPSYISLRDIVTERTRSIVAWVGSGLSTPAGLPTWATLKRSLLNDLKSKLLSMDVDERRVEKTINSISNETNNWIAFGRLAHELGDASFKDAIRRALNVPDRIDVPSTYTNLWRLKIRGMLNLNLDRLATRAFCEVTYENENNCKVNPNEFHGIRAKSLAHVLSNPKPFIANLHGVADESASWVLTYESLKQLTNDDGYKAFIQTCILSNTVLFVGISADDQAAGGYLEKLVNMDVDIGVNYWITDRIDIATDKWAEKNGIRIIRYKSHDSDVLLG